MSDIPLAGDVFLDLVNEVLVEAGRRKLEGNNRDIITVLPTDRVLQILAGPGSGKTEMIVWRVLYELTVGGRDSNRVVVTTFTRKAATELSVRLAERCDALLAVARRRGVTVADPRVHDLRVGTIHSLCDSLLAEFDATHMAQGTEVIDEFESQVRLMRVHPFEIGYRNAGGRVLNRLIEASQLVALFRAPWDDNESWPSSSIDRVAFIQGLLSQHTETWIPRCAAKRTPNGIEKVHKVQGLTADLIKVQERWEAYLDKQHILDFSTLQKRFWERQASVSGHIDHVFVDEFQDTNPIQLELHLGWLKNDSTRLTVVGDDDQAMYRFRGSDIECFTKLVPHCQALQIPIRVEKLEKNWRSTKAIVAFAAKFKANSVLYELSMPKKVEPGDDAADGAPVRILRGPWPQLTDLVADEIAAINLGMRPDETIESAAVLMFSTSEKETKNGVPAALELRRVLEGKGVRVFNPRNKSAGRNDSPIAELLALISYLIDPVTVAPAGKKGRPIFVWASMHDADKAAYAPTVPPPFFIVDAHAALQKRFLRADGGEVGSPSGDRADLTAYVDKVRAALLAHKSPRLTVAGFVSRLLSFPRYRHVPYSDRLFRQALFTSLLEANIAPSRRTMHPLDGPMKPSRDRAGKVVWPDEYWTFLNIFGTLLANTSFDDVEVEAFAESALAMMTFHQAKGLEFDYVYVAGTGRDVAPHSALQTLLFSGETPKYKVRNAQPVTSDKDVLKLAAADRERELYVALTRAKKRLTFLLDPTDDRPFMGTNPRTSNSDGWATSEKAEAPRADRDPGVFACVT